MSKIVCYKAELNMLKPEITELFVDYIGPNHVYILGLAYASMTDKTLFTKSRSVAKHFLASKLHMEIVHYHEKDVTLKRQCYDSLIELENL